MSEEQQEQQRPPEKASPVRGGDSNGVKDARRYHYKEKKIWFHPGRLFAGILVILIGVFLLLNSLGLVQVNMELGIWDLWPVLVILIGLSMISFRGFLGALIGIIAAVLAAAIVFLVLFGHLTVTGERWNDLEFQFGFSTNEIFQPKVVEQ